MINSTKSARFESKIRALFPANAESILEAINTPRLPTFRLNYLYSDSNDYLKLLSNDISFEEAPIKDAYFYRGLMRDLSTNNAFSSGRFYIQGLSSMLPVFVLEPNEGDKILDLCAAPGSKSSLIASITHNNVLLTCVDSNVARLSALKANLDDQKVENYRLIRADASRIQYMPEHTCKYDKVLADVPCSNEGNIRLSQMETLTKWNPKLPKKISQLQKKILASGIHSLKPGGKLVYSTCTYSPEENEFVVDWALKKFPNIRVIPIEIKLSNVIAGFTEINGKKLNPQVANTIRIFPTDLFDGFFVACLLLD